MAIPSPSATLKTTRSSYHRNAKGDTFNFLYSRLNKYSETWNENGYRRKVFFDDQNNVTRIDNEDTTIITKSYDEFHNITSHTDGNGFTSTYTYGTKPELRLLHSKTNALGEAWRFVYNSAENPYAPSAITNPLGVITQLTYYPNGRIHQKIAAPNYAYAADGNLLLSPGAPGFVTTYTYDQFGNLTSMADPLGNSSNFEYSENGLDLLAKIDPNRHIISYTYYEANNAQNMPPGMIKAATVATAASVKSGGYSMEFEYNHYNQMTKVTDSLGQVTTQEYNANRQPTKVISPNGAVRENIYDKARSIVHGGDIVQATDPLGASEYYQYDALGNVIAKEDKNGNSSSYVYDGMNRLIEEVDAFDHSNQFSYDGNGNLVRTIDKNGNQSTTDFDAAGRKVKETDSIGNSTLFQYDAAGRPIKRIDAVGRISKFSYDALDRLVTKVIDADTPDSRTFGYRYDDANRLIKEIMPRGDYIHYEYDAAGNRRFADQYDGNDNLIQSTEYLYHQDTRNLVAEVIVDGGKDYSQQGTRFEYDPLGRQTATIDPLGQRVETVYDPVGNPVVVSTPTGIVKKSFDLNSRLLQTVNPLGEVTSQSYDRNGNILSKRDANGNTTTIFYDALNRKIGEQDALGHQTVFDYDSASNMVQLTDANGGVTRFSYDANNRKRSEQRPEGQETLYSYNELNQIQSVVYGAGHMVKYDYNALGKPTQIDYFGPENRSSPGKTVNYNYDANGNLASYTDGTTSADYLFDALGRKTKETVHYPNFSKSFSYAYPNHWQQTFTGPDNVTITADYDEAQRLATISIPGAGQFNYSDYTWLRPRTITLPGDATISQSYDALLRTTGILVKDGNNNLVMNHGYDFDKVGNVVQKTTEHGLSSYSYDALSRITDADNSDLPDEHLTYDALGNRVTDNAVVGNLTYNLNNELTTLGGAAVSFDLNGNMTENRWPTIAQKYVYDETRRLKQIKDIHGNVQAEYYYDPFGRRLWKDVQGVRTYFMYANEGLIAEFDANGNQTRGYGYMPGSSWTTNPLYQKVGGSYYWYINDHLGTPQKMIGTDGTVVWSARHDSFGNTEIDVETVKNNLRFPGQYYDEESGLNYNWNRYYEPLLGRYLQSDPLELDAGINFYVYANSNPLRFVDQMGLDSWSGCENTSGGPTGPGGAGDRGEGYGGGGNGDGYNSIAEALGGFSSGRFGTIGEALGSFGGGFGFSRDDNVNGGDDPYSYDNVNRINAVMLNPYLEYPNNFIGPLPERAYRSPDLSWDHDPDGSGTREVKENVFGMYELELYGANPNLFNELEPKLSSKNSHIPRVAYDYSDWRKGLAFGFLAASYVAYEVTTRQLTNYALSLAKPPSNLAMGILGVGYRTYKNIQEIPDLSTTLSGGINQIRDQVFNNSLRYE